MGEFEESIVKRNESWIKASKMQIDDYKKFIEHEKRCIKDLSKQNRVMKGKDNNEN